MRKFACFGLLFLLLSLAVPQLMAQQEPNVTTDSVLQLLDSEPTTGEELALDGKIALYFDRPIDCSTVGNAFSIQPNINGSLSCDGASIIFTPSSNFDRANTYVVQLDTSLRGADGAQLLEALKLQFDTVGFIQVSETFPSPDSSDVELNATLTIIFNRPIVPLTVREDMANFPSPIRMLPDIQGKGEWLNTSIYTFKPSGLLQANTSYSVLVGAGLTSTDGAVLPEDYVFNFTTQSVSVVQYSPMMGEADVALDSSVQIRFNQELDHATVESAFSLRPAESSNKVSGTFKWADDGLGFQFVPDNMFDYDTRYVVNFDESIIGALDLCTNSTTCDWDFTTVPRPAIINTNPSNGDQGSYPYGGVIIYFASPMNEETLKDKVTIDPAPQYEPRFYYRDWSNSYEISFQPWPGTKHTITIAPGAEDVYGTPITEAYSFSYTTANLDPEVSLRVPGSIGFYNANRKPTQVFVTYRNIDSFTISLHTVPLEQFSNFMLDPNRYYYDLSYDFQPLPNTEIASWKVDGTVVPKDALRFDMLQFDKTLGTSSCGNSLPSHLKVGDTAVVIAEPDAVRARSAPVDGDVVDLLYKGYALPIVDGPVCGQDGLLPNQSHNR